MRPQSLAVLQYLAERAGQAISTEELLRHAWPDRIVTKTVLRVCIREIRQALDDEATSPQWIATVVRYGYRFIGQVYHQPPGAYSHQAEASASRGRIAIVGRDHEVERLHQWLMTALGGQRQLGFVTGEPGIGKTSVVNLFLDQVRAAGQVYIGHGQCVEHAGKGEAYLPMLEALGRLCREPGGTAVQEVLRRYAPTWCAQLPALLSDAERQASHSLVLRTTQQRMLRELADALEVLTAEQGYVFVLEDLHWSDSATAELLGYLAQRTERARFLIIGTYRPAHLAMREHALLRIKRELQARGQCTELVLAPLSRDTVHAYVALRLPRNLDHHQLSLLLYARTEGNPLFMVTLLQHLLERGRRGENGLRVETDLPEGLRQLILKQLEELSPDEREVLAVGSAVGMEFAVATVAAGLRRSEEEIEERCERLSRAGSFIERAGLREWPEGTASGCYRFRHALYRQAVYERIAEGRRMRLHRRIGQQIEAGHEERAGEVAGEMALHFAQGWDAAQAARYPSVRGGAGVAP